MSSSVELGQNNHNFPVSTKNETGSFAGEHLLPETPEEIIRQAEDLALIGQPLCEKVRKEVEDVRSALEETGLFSEEDQDLDKQINIMGAITTDAFLKKEQAIFPERNFALLHKSLCEEEDQDELNMTSIEFLNMILTGEGMYFDSSGRQVNMERYLQDYYQPLIEEGFNIKIITVPAHEVRLTLGSYINLLDTPDESLLLPEVKTVLNLLRERKAPVPVLVLKIQEVEKQIPILHSPADKAGYIPGHMILIDGWAGKNIIPLSSSMVHEFDHAIFDFFYELRLNQAEESQTREIDEEIQKKRKQVETLLSSWDKALELPSASRLIFQVLSRKLFFLKTQSSSEDINGDWFEKEYRRQEEEILALEAQKTQIEERYRHGAEVNEFGKITAYEGLAQSAKRTFLRRQVRGMANYSDFQEEVLIEASLLKHDLVKLENQVGLKNLKYEIGELLISMILNPETMKLLYTTDALDREVISGPDLIKALIRYLAKSQNQTARAFNEITATHREALDVLGMKQQIVLELGLYNLNQFLLGQEYYEISNAILETMTEEEVEARIEEIRSTSTDIPAPQNQERKRGFLYYLELTCDTGILNVRFNEELDKILDF